MSEGFKNLVPGRLPISRKAHIRKWSALPILLFDFGGVVTDIGVFVRGRASGRDMGMVVDGGHGGCLLWVPLVRNSRKYNRLA